MIILDESPCLICGDNAEQQRYTSPDSWTTEHLCTACEWWADATVRELETLQEETP